MSSPRPAGEGDDAARFGANSRTREKDVETRPVKAKVKDDSRRAGKLTLTKVLSSEEGGRQRSLASMKRKQERERRRSMGAHDSREKVVRDVQLPETIVVQELANRMAERVADVVKALMQSGLMVTQNQTIDADTAELVVGLYGVAFPAELADPIPLELVALSRRAARLGSG